ncbi:hypothetical protein CPB84DRAFT_1768490 [Gymnopilus junonius]|uniref:Uncharacterized protein n=1 Tax=Gymnopilus junonius TaxID=109634 RepID=A0A9P5NWD9_GYMJU|nr:hypothetical protein CPB84DRAFT_1768490 [Gymnopilus junonius]
MLLLQLSEAQGSVHVIGKVLPRITTVRMNYCGSLLRILTSSGHSPTHATIRTPISARTRLSSHFLFLLRFSIFLMYFSDWTRYLCLCISYSFMRSAVQRCPTDSVGNSSVGFRAFIPGQTSSSVLTRNLRTFGCNVDFKSIADASSRSFTQACCRDHYFQAFRNNPFSFPPGDQRLRTLFCYLLCPFYSPLFARPFALS